MFRYASFNRPLWLCFDPGVSYKIVDIKESDKINGRTPHNVIETEERISPEKLYSLELTSYEEVEAKNRLYIYAKSKFTGRYLDNINYLIHEKTITTPEKIDYYYNKLQKTLNTNK